MCASIGETLAKKPERSAMITMTLDALAEVRKEEEEGEMEMAEADSEAYTTYSRSEQKKKEEWITS